MKVPVHITVGLVMIVRIRAAMILCSALLIYCTGYIAIHVQITIIKTVYCLSMFLGNGQEMLSDRFLLTPSIH